MNVLDYVAHETERQSGTIREGLGMYGAWQYFVDYTEHEGDYIAEGALIHMHRLIKNENRGGYRLMEVTFNQMSYPPVPADSVPRAMKRLIELINRVDTTWNEWADYLAREFLIVHPFSDGNGRVASLLWNRLRGTLGDPEPMPYFFGEG